jgi:ammonia channel protein AmtB
MLYLGGNLLLAACRSVTHAPWPTFDFLNVFLGGVSGLLLWLLFAMRSRRIDAVDWPLGMISGIISVTAGCSSMPPSSAIIVAAIGVFLCCLVLSFHGPTPSIHWLLFAVHGASGVAGLVLAGIFSSPEIAGSDVAGKPIVGFVAGNVELLRVQLLTATVTAMVAFAGGVVLPPVARVIGTVLERLFSRQLALESSLPTKTYTNA